MKGANGGWFDVAELLVLSVTGWREKLASMKKYFGSRPTNTYVQFRGNQWMKAEQSGPPSNFIQTDKRHAPIYRDEKQRPS